MKYYKLLVAYDGTDYSGWQSQGNGQTVAEALVKSFVEVFKKQPVLRGVSRTDAGVHAHGQLVLLKTHVDIDPAKISFAWNNRLPSSIVVRDVKGVTSDFKLQAKIVEKTYFYHFFTKQPQPFASRYGWYVPKNIDIDKLRAALSLFVGTHDFRSFCTGDDWPDTVRTINSIDLAQLDTYKYRITVRGPRFLRYMILRIVGACIQIASNPYIDIDMLVKVREQKNPQQTLLNAPAKGLLLFNVRYEDEDKLDEKNHSF